ncbi:unnamed protein product [Pneumocystis jirovecii]|uniref:Armadillo-like helical domain-containing protein n=1 Tax=Pneumocystis jirovecii TaxID=42068 RepID=L0PH76_PNEJI|nr:unnamed protein product [Pneumocystis jirovecii]
MQEKKGKVFQRNFKPKIVAQYERVFHKEKGGTLDRRFFLDLYLLECDLQELESILEELTGDQLLFLQVCYVCFHWFYGHILQNNTRGLFMEGVSIIKKADPLRLENVLDVVKNKLEDFVTSLEVLIQKESKAILRTKALRLCLCTVCHGFNSNIVSYFHHKDFFPSIIKYITDPSTFSTAFLAFLFLGVLANNKKFESQNLYQTRLSDFVDNNTMQLIVHIISTICIECKNEYISLQNNGSDNAWGFMNILTYFNDMFFNLNNHKSISENSDNVSSENGVFSLPSFKAAILLPMYDFINVNKAFCYIFITIGSSANNSEIETPFSQFISFTSYLLEYQSFSLRAGYYARLALLIIHILVDDDGCFAALASDANSSVVHLCRQKQSFLPLAKNKRILLLAIFDSLIMGLEHNLKRNLDIENLHVQILLNIISSLEKKKIRLEYHWQGVWRFLMRFIMFLLTNAKTLKQHSRIDELISILLNFISLCVTRDLIYKLIQNGDTVRKFIKAYEMESSSSKAILLPHELSPEKVTAAIKEGYGLFNLNLIENNEYNEYNVRFKEAKERVFLKSIARIVVSDADRSQLQ